MPDWDDLVLESKPIETKEVIQLIKNVQKDLTQKFVTDSKMFPLKAQIDELSNRVSNIQMEMQHSPNASGAKLPIVL